MRHIVAVLIVCSVVLGGPAVARAKCGSRPGDAAEVVVTEATVAAACPCCGVPRTVTTCVRVRVRAAIRAKTLPGRCASTVRRDLRSTCPLPAAACTTTTTTTLPAGGCTTDADCDDGNGCSFDHCVGGTCEHDCICAGPGGAATCCPGPAAVCVPACGATAAGTCGGACPSGAMCEASAAATCGCVSGLGGPCGGNILDPPPVCAAGLVCQRSNPDVTGVCVASDCIPFFQPGCTQTADCCEPCLGGRIAPCAVCLQGVCYGAP